MNILVRFFIIYLFIYETIQYNNILNYYTEQLNPFNIDNMVKR